MNLGLKNKMAFQGTVVSNAFIDTYMTAANGEYVKVFLYLLRHEGEEVTVSAIADALDHTEADVKRALAYWEEAGLLEREGDGGRPELRQSAEKEAAAARDVEIPEEGNSCDRMERLSGDEEFTALLYAVQQYLGKTFTQIECEKFAFFYDGLKMSGDLLEYLAEYCAGGGHSSIRYIEKVALNWYQMGIHTREEARDYTMRYSRDTSAVMKAFGITGRSPATAETEFMKRWFKEFGFDCKMVTEACGRTIKATGTASFPYADKILTGWKEAGVKTLGDVEELDRRRQASKRQDRREPGNGRGQETGRKAAGSNRFKNFEERTYNYEDYVWEDMRRRQQKGGRMDGTE